MIFICILHNTVYIYFIETKQHTATGENHTILLGKVAILKSLLASHAGQIKLHKLKIQELIRENEVLEEAAADSKWAHILTKSAATRTAHKLEKALREIEGLKEALRIAKLPKNSSNSSLAPSSDLYRPKRSKNHSLRKKSKRKPGGQVGHQGTTLEFSPDPADQTIEHVVESCAACGKSLADIEGENAQTHQVIDIAIPKKVVINHTTVTKYCGCGHCNRAVFPTGAKGQVNYGDSVRGLVANLSVRQFMPYKRTAEFMKDVFGISISEGTVTNLLDQFQQSAAQTYRDIQTRIFHAPVVGSDETGAKINGAKGWFHTYQSPEYTFIGYHPSRGTVARKHFYPDGLPNAILVSDCFAMQLSTPAAAHQLCNVHLLRELHAMEETHPKQAWPRKMKALILKSLELRGIACADKKIKAVEREFECLLKTNQSNAPGKIPAFWKRMNKHKDKVFTFLHYPMAPAENNASERAIRNVKVKQKVSGQFKTPKGAENYAVIRSIIDTMIKQRKNVHRGLAQIACLDR